MSPAAWQLDGQDRRLANVLRVYAPFRLLSAISSNIRPRSLAVVACCAGVQGVESDVAPSRSGFEVISVAGSHDGGAGLVNGDLD